MRSKLRALGLGSVVTAGLVLATLAAGASEAADPFVAGQPSTRAVPADAAARTRAVERLQALSTRLGLPAAARHVALRLDDRVEHATYDQVTAYDARGEAVGLARYELDGRLRLAIHLGWRLEATAAAATLQAAAVGGRARSVLASAGIDVAGEPVVERQTAGWLASWPRTAAGYPVPGDGVKVTLWPDGSFHALSRSDRPLAAIPASIVAEAGARSLARARLAGLAGTAGTGTFVITGLRLAWIAPNDMFDAALPDAPAATLRLAWLVRAEATGAAAERLQAVELWIDAGDGRSLGGDVLR